ncbi:MAG: SDR family oxidoreductase [Candidatus Rokubacteria bacterium]|nr:SDR family oxidoreductase [Candidatus Rokubacteria bacterium]
MTPPSRAADLTGQVALVTGAGRGIGHAVALALAAVGADIAALDLEPPAETQRRVERAGRRCLPLAADVSDRAAVDVAVAETLARLGRLDIVVNNAGVAERRSLEELDDRTLGRALDVILRGTILVSQAAYPHLKQRGGAIVNISSVSGMAGGAVSRPDPSGAAARGRRSGPAYAAAKGGVIAFTRWLAKDAGRYGIRVNTVAPGPVETEMTRGFDYDVAAQPIARIGQPGDIAQAVVYLASSMANFVTGQVLVVDGGVVLD